MSEEQTKRGFFDGDPRMLFVFGLVTGVALTLIFGNVSFSKTDAPKEGTPVAVDGGSEELVLAPVTENDHIRGDVEKAKVVMVEYSDFECPYCARHHETMVQLMDDYGDDIAWVYRSFPLSSHENAVPAGLAAECASEQGKFWEYGDLLVENYDRLSEDLYTELAEDLKLDMDDFTSCYDSQKYLDKLNSDLASGVAAGVEGTPATYINGVLVSGAVPYETMKSAIDSFLAE